MKQRNVTIDIAKGIGILLVVMGHLCRKDGEGWEGAWIYSFHMPLFFILSGYCFNKNAVVDLKALLKKRSKQILLPSIYLAIMFTIISVGVINGYNWHEIFKTLPYGLWFIPVLFFAYTLYSVFIKYFAGYMPIAIIIMLLLGLSLHQYGIEMPFSLSTVPVAFFYFAVGVWFKDHISIMEQGLRISQALIWGGDCVDNQHGICVQLSVENIFLQ